MSADRHNRNAVDTAQFHAVFFEECAEHLAEMERILISLSDSAPDPEGLNAIFRAAHSIKGGAGIFGFHDMTVVTHALESLLDRVRNHEIPFATALIDLFLEAGDVIGMQVDGHRTGAPVDQGAVDRIRIKLEQVIDGASGRGAPVFFPAVGPTPDGDGELRISRRYEIVFTPEQEIFKRGVRLDCLFDELRDLGELSVVARLPETVLLGPAFDPEICRSSWLLTFEGPASEADIRDVFEFAVDAEHLVVREIAPEKPGASRHEEPPRAEGEPGEGAAVGDEPALADTRQEMPGRRGYDGNELASGAFGRRCAEAEASIRVGVGKVDQLINQVGELVTTQLMVAQAASSLDPVTYENLHRSLLQLERTTRDLQQSVMSIRLVPIGIVFSRFPRMVRELAAKLGKQVELKTVGETTELDKGLIEKITDPLAHLVRNALDHALETPEVRRASGKEPTGTVTLGASQVGGRIVIEVIDDGAGLNRDKILGKALQQGMPVSEGMTDEEVWQLIFAPGFSTAAAVTDISGRGVGMDVVLKNVQSIGGRVHISSQPGKGTKVTVSLPLTLAIVDGLSVAVGAERFIIPLNCIVESLQPPVASLKSINGNKVVQVRGDYLPVLPIHELFHLETEVVAPERGILVLVEVEGEKAALLVDALLDEHQVVIKSMETNYRKVEGTAGATILGDGRVALILDVGALFEMHRKKEIDNDSQPEVAPSCN